MNVKAEKQLPAMKNCTLLDKTQRQEQIAWLLKKACGKEWFTRRVDGSPISCKGAVSAGRDRARVQLLQSAAWILSPPLDLTIAVSKHMIEHIMVQVKWDCLIINNMKSAILNKLLEIYTSENNSLSVFEEICFSLYYSLIYLFDDLGFQLSFVTSIWHNISFTKKSAAFFCFM